jgi:integrase
VFAATNGAHLDADNLRRRIMKPGARKAGVGWAGFHTLRHTCATNLFRRGLNAKQVQIWMGHHSPAFTLDTYVHLLSDDLPDADQLGTSIIDQGATPGPPDPPKQDEIPERALAVI